MAAMPELTTCPSHPAEAVLFTCAKCGDIFACSRCVTTVHRGHVLNGVEDTARSLGAQIPDLVRSRQADMETVATRFEDIETNYNQTTDNLKNVMIEVELRRIKLNVEVDRIAGDITRIIRALMDSNDAAVYDYKSKLDDLRDRLLYLVKEQGDAVLLFGTATETMNFYKDLVTPPLFPRLPVLRRARFTSLDHDMSELGQVFGDFADMAKKIDVQDPPNLPPRAGQESVPPGQSHRRGDSETGQYDVVDVFCIQQPSESGIRSLCYTDNKFQICYKMDRRILFVNQSGKTTRKLRVQSNITDACVSPQTGSTWICCADHSVSEIGPKTQTVHFHTKDMPLSICVQQDGRILVGIANALLQYNTVGDILRRIRCWGGKATPIYPRTVRVCPATGNVAVSHGLDVTRPTKITLLDTHLQFIFQYPPDTDASEEVVPSDICFTADGQLVVLDKAHNRLVWVGMQGVLLRETRPQHHRPSVMTLGPENTLCLLHQSRTSKILTVDLDMINTGTSSS